MTGSQECVASPAARRVPQASLRAAGRASRGGTAQGGALVIGTSGGASVLAVDALPDRAGVPLGPLPDRCWGTAGLVRGPVLPGQPTGGARRPAERAGPGPAGGRGDRAAPAVPGCGGAVNVQSFFTYGTRAEPLFEYARALAAAQDALPVTRVTLVAANGECAPPGVEDEVRAIVAAGRDPV